VTNPYQPPLDGNPPGARYLPEVPVAIDKPAPPAPRLELLTTWSRLDYAETFQGWQLTPQRVAWIFRQADYGWAWQMIDMYEAIALNDGHLRGLFEQRMDELEVPWTLRPGDDRPGSAQAAVELEAACRTWDMTGLIQHLQLQPFYGFSYGEIPWQSRADGVQIPVDAVCVPHRRFAFDLQSRARLTSELDPYPGELLERRPGSSWVCAETKRWRKQTQAGLFRTAAYWAVFKRMSVRDWLIFAEKFGIPMIVGKYADTSSEKTRQALAQAIEALGTEGRALLAEGATVEVIDKALRSGGGGDHLHAGITQLANSEISKIITAGTLTSDVGGPGSFALGQVHADQKHKLSLADARRIGIAFQRDIGTEFLRRNNLLDKAAPPWLHLHVQKLSLLTDSQVVKNLVSVGLPMSIGQLREQFGYRAPKDDDDTLKQPEPTDGAANADPADPHEPADPPV
jgi:phage gp29-like protein